MFLQVNDLHKLVTGWESVASVVPDLVSKSFTNSVYDLVSVCKK